jgi:3-hydroxyisobutyrate dehydrogenase
MSPSSRRLPATRGSAPSIGIVGVGEVGFALAQSESAAGFDLVVHDRVPQAAARLGAPGVRVAASPRELAAAVEVVQIAVLDDAQLLDVLSGPEGALAGLRPGAALVVHSTVLPRTVRELALRAPGIDVIDAPLSIPSGASGIHDGTATFLVGGAQHAVERIRPLLEASAREVFHLGPLGSGLVAKLIRNFAMYVTLLAAQEARAFARAAGLDRDTLRAVLAASGASSRAMDHYLGRSAYDDAYRARLPALTAIFEKDLRWAIEVAAELGVALPAAELVRRHVADILPADGEL